jgi:hypothetical protein
MSKRIKKVKMVTVFTDKRKFSLDEEEEGEDKSNNNPITHDSPKGSSHSGKSTISLFRKNHTFNQKKLTNLNRKTIIDLVVRDQMAMLLKVDSDYQLLKA